MTARNAGKDERALKHGHERAQMLITYRQTDVDERADEAVLPRIRCKLKSQARQPLKVNEAPQRRSVHANFLTSTPIESLSRYSNSALHVERLLCPNGFFAVIFAREAAQSFYTTSDLRKQELRNRDAEDFQKAEHALISTHLRPCRLLID
jgi:hypothetical protein